MAKVGWVRPLPTMGSDLYNKCRGFDCEKEVRTNPRNCMDRFNSNSLGLNLLSDSGRPFFFLSVA